MPISNLRFGFGNNFGVKYMRKRFRVSPVLGGVQNFIVLSLFFNPFPPTFAMPTLLKSRLALVLLIAAISTKVSCQLYKLRVFWNLVTVHVWRVGVSREVQQQVPTNGLHRDSHFGCDKHAWGRALRIDVRWLLRMHLLFVQHGRSHLLPPIRVQCSSR